MNDIGDSQLNRAFTLVGDLESEDSRPTAAASSLGTSSQGHHRVEARRPSISYFPPELGGLIRRFCEQDVEHEYSMVEDLGTEVRFMSDPPCVWSSLV